MSAAPQPAPNMAAIIDAAHGQSIKPAADRWVIALKQARANAADPDRAIVDAIIALEEMEKAASDIAKTLRQELALSMQADGLTGFKTDHHHVVLADGARRPQVLDTKALAAAHPDLMVPQDPKPDMTEVGRRLKNCQHVEGAILTNGGAPVLRISARKDATA